MAYGDEEYSDYSGDGYDDGEAASVSGTSVGDDPALYSDGEGVEQFGEGEGEGEGEDEPELALTEEMMTGALSILAKTGNGLTHAYVRAELHETEVTDIDLLAHYVHIRYLDFSLNRIRSIRALSELDQLLTINFEDNNITDVGDLKTRKYLQNANLAGNKISNGSNMKHPMLATLNLSRNTFASIQGLNKLENLTFLDLSDNQLTSTGGLALPNLKTLLLASNRITKIEGLENLPSLEVLELPENELVELDGFPAEAAALHTLDLSGNYIESEKEVAKLVSLPKLANLFLIPNEVEKVNDYRMEVLIVLPKLVELDGEPFADEDREEGVLITAERKEEAERLAKEEAERKAREEREEKERLEAEAAAAAAAAAAAVAAEEEGEGEGEGEDGNEDADAGSDAGSARSGGESEVDGDGEGGDEPYEYGEYTDTKSRDEYYSTDEEDK